LALVIFDTRLAGEEIKGLVGQTDLGSPSIHAIRREVNEIKRLAERFAARLGDFAFATMVDKAMAAEAETIGKRKQTMAARQEG
jgi:hypothetical protein